MEYIITDRKFMAIKGINRIKGYDIKILDYEILNDSILGQIRIDISYFDNDELENLFHSNLPFSVFLDEGNITNINSNNEVLNVIDNQGVELEYELVVNYEENVEIIKEEIKEEVEEALIEALKERDDSFLEPNRMENPIKIIEEEIKIDQAIPQFNESYKTFKVVLFDDLKDVSVKYDIKESTLITGLLSENMVMFKVDE